MNAEQYEKLMKDLKAKKEADSVVGVDELPEGYEGTLLYGYDCDRNTLHVYAKEGEIHAITYNRHSGIEVKKHVHGKQLKIEECYPNKRVYRQETQGFFAQILYCKGAEFSITDSGAEKDESIGLGEFLERGLIGSPLSDLLIKS